METGHESFHSIVPVHPSNLVSSGDTAKPTSILEAGVMASDLLKDANFQVFLSYFNFFSLFFIFIFFFYAWRYYLYQFKNL